MSIHSGPGYRLINREKLTVDALAGPGVKKEWNSENDDLYVESIVAIDTQWEISPRQTLAFFSGYYPVITDFSDYRNRNRLDWRFLINRELKMSFLVGLEHEFISIVDPDSKHNGTRVFSGIHLDF